ncbi:PPOX class F420-dependent oxidoreductase [Actinospica sp. MGRD01-02]|uniref:PPOX class F420-dependent oxidoreductase n=1 Tax=Actinospica acidithermotolerans TaxID=2828514 RepID=A0A941IJF4_9ACTN|nr:PPOX class F420-dependent oxidoreductase [Actinospica acidithermotolerans]MBR7829394.1 PPOX class F420-dependent oxidoreductase [Actinospica acidithermotolerans]
MTRKLATNTTVDRAGLTEFLRTRHNGLVITSRADGVPQASPVTCGVDEQGRIVVSTYPQRAKARNARRDPNVSIVVLSDDFGDAWVQVNGTAELIDAEVDVEPLVDYFRCIAGEHPNWDEYRAAMIKQGKTLLRITPVSWGPIATGGFPPELAEG